MESSSPCYDMDYDAHIVAPSDSPPQSSSPALETPPDADSHEHSASTVSQEGYLGESESVSKKSGSDNLRDLGSTETPYSEPELDWSVAWQRDDLDTEAGQALFSRRLDGLLHAVQHQRLNAPSSRPVSLDDARSDSVPTSIDALPSCDPVTLKSGAESPSVSASASVSVSTAKSGPPGEPIQPSAKAAHNGSPATAKRPRSDSSLNHEALHGRMRKKYRLSANERRSVQPHVTGLSGAFGRRYAKGPGSLRRAESLRSDLVLGVSGSARTRDENVLPCFPLRRIGRSPNANATEAGTPQETTSSFDGYAATVPTTPTVRAKAAQNDGLANIPIMAPPPFELIPRAPLSAEEAAEARTACLLEKELKHMSADGLHMKEPPSKRPPKIKRAEDEEERFWMDDTGDCPDEDDVETWLAEEEARECRYRVRACGKGPTTSSTKPASRARTASAPIELGIGENLLEECMDWIIEVMPSDESEATCVAGDLYDILSESSEIRFHAGHLFLRYFSLVGHPTGSTSTGRDEDAEAFESVAWDIAVACLAISVKFHRDVLYPLDVIYAHEYLDLAPHALTFDDLENAQRDVLEALAFRVGSATPGAFMAELWDALPTLRLLVAFDGGWAEAQESAWTILCNVLLDADMLRYPISLLTAAALIEGVLEVLARRYKTAKFDGRGRALKKRDEKSRKKAARKAAHGVRLDIRDVLGISDDELVECRKWLKLSED